MKWVDDGMACLTFQNLGLYPALLHGVFTRKGGVSLSPFDTLNIGFSTGDKRAHVIENRERIFNFVDGTEAEKNENQESRGGRRSAEIGGGDYSSSSWVDDVRNREKKRIQHMVFVHQVHGDRIAIIRQDGSGIFIEGEVGSTPPKADAIITNVKGLLTVIQVADCQGVILYDPVAEVVANVHSGWRGSVLNILAKTVRQMTDCFGSRPENIRGAISPSLGPCCAEFIHYRQEIPSHLWKYRAGEGVSDAAHKENHFDFWQISLDQLASEGVDPQKVDVAGICTACHTDRFYSYRKEKRTGRFAVVAAISL